MVSLNSLSPGERGVIRSFVPDCKYYRSKLLSMGVTPGTEIRVIRFAPMGDPMELELRGYRLSLRRSECQAVMVERV
ncbi:MAG: FeoA family protein [Spirochaeta sp.]